MIVAMLSLSLVHGPQKPGVAPFRILQPLTVRFRLAKPGAMIVVGRDFAVADPPGLYLCEGRSHIRVRSFVGKVIILSAEGALDYVRLWTSPLTYALPEASAVLEPIRVSDLEGSVPLAERHVREIENPFYPWHGVVPDEWLRGWPPPKVVGNHGRFTVTRRVLRVNERKEVQVADAQEVVTRDGHVRRTFTPNVGLSRRRDWSRAYRRGDLGGY